MREVLYRLEGEVQFRPLFIVSEDDAIGYTTALIGKLSNKHNKIIAEVKLGEQYGQFLH